MSELQAYYDEFRLGYWADPDPELCRCHGSGWALSEVDTWHECPCHYTGQSNPELDGYDGAHPEYEAQSSGDVPSLASCLDEARASLASLEAGNLDTVSPWLTPEETIREARRVAGVRPKLEDDENIPF